MNLVERVGRGFNRTFFPFMREHVDYWEFDQQTRFIDWSLGIVRSDDAQDLDESGLFIQRYLEDGFPSVLKFLKKYGNPGRVAIIEEAYQGLRSEFYDAVGSETVH